MLLPSIDIKEFNKLTRGVPTVETSGSQLGKEEQGPIRTANLLLFLLEEDTDVALILDHWIGGC